MRALVRARRRVKKRTRWIGGATAHFLIVSQLLYSACVFIPQMKMNGACWKVLCRVNGYLKTTTTADGHSHIHIRHSLSDKPLKHLTFHPTSSGAKSFYWLSIFFPLVSPNKRALCLWSAALLPCPSTAGWYGCECASAYIVVRVFLCDFMRVYVGFLTKRKWVLIVFLR